ncbi:hypothetical protein BFJ70_g16313 [Fusarium oxysporum]|nr:hypothetical protein BFJ70_g16313 [Fusarium oxysporum]
MSQGYWDVQNNPKVHDGEVELDQNIIAELPSSLVVRSCRGHGGSNWNTTARIDGEINGEQVSYFLKLTEGPNAGPMFKGEFESMSLIHQFIPDFSPKPLAWGKCEESDRFFNLFDFHVLRPGNPPIPQFTNAVAQLHNLSVKANPTGRFGFHVPTYNGTLEQDNDWTDSWEEFYARGMRHMLKLDEAARGPSDELKDLKGPFFDKVIPRLLRPLETNGRKVTPVLIHGDLWLGNVSVKEGTDDPLMFDASAFWGHNEYELSYMRPLGNDWAQECFKSYHERIPKSEPVEDWDARNALYATRIIIHDSALYPEVEHFRTTLINEMQKLVKQFPDGYVEEI